MNILYSKKNMANCFEGCAIGNFWRNGNGLIFFNKNIMKFYILDKNFVPVFLYDKLLFENILQIETYRIDSNSDGLLILFESTKMCSIHFVDDTPVINSLKFFERNEYDIRHKDEKFIRLNKNTAILKICRRYFSIFSLKDNGFPAKVFCFTEIDERCKNVIDIVFMTNYTTPTFCVVFNSTPRSYVNACENHAIICSYDEKLNTFYVIEEFNVPTYTFKALFSRDVIVLVSNNELLFKSAGSVYCHPLNKMSLYCTEKPLKDIVIKDAQFYFENEHLIIFNGNGVVHNIFIEIDSGRINNIIFEDSEIFNIPKYISRLDNLVFFGSNEESYLFEVSFSTMDSHDDTLEIKKQRLNMEEIDIIINEEYEKLYGASIGSTERNIIRFTKLYEFQGIGYINDLCVRNDREFVACSEGSKNYIIEFSNYMKLDIKKTFDCINYERMITFGERIFLKKDCEVIEYNKLENSTSLPFDISQIIISHDFEGIRYIITKNQIIILKDDNFTFEDLDFEIVSAKFYKFESEIFVGLFDNHNVVRLRNLVTNTNESFESVASFGFYDRFLVLNISNRLIFYNFKLKQNQWIINDITNLDHNYKLENIDDTNDRTEYNKIVEMEFIEYREDYYLFLINDRGHLSIYRIEDDNLIKMFVDEAITFSKQKSNKYFTKIQDFIYLSSKMPYFLYINERKELYFYRSFLAVRDIYFNNGKCLFLIHDRVVQVNLPKIQSTNLLKKSNIFKNMQVENKDLYDKYIFKKIAVDKIPKSVEISGNYILVVSCEKVKFRESLEEENACDVYTYKYSIDLYTNSYKYMSSFELENDEYVFDIKELSLNDSIGVNGKSNFIVVCVTKIEGEDKHSRGRLIILELIDIVTDESSKYKDKKLKLIASENIKGCIIKCDEVKGNVIVALGIKTMVYKIDRSDGLIPIGIHDLHTLTTSLVTIKNLVLSCDIYRGLSFFYFQKKPVRLNLICTSEPIQYATHLDYIVKGSSLGIICMDIEGNMQTFTYSPLNILSCDGTKFVKRCETKFNLGRLIMKKSHSKMSKPVFISDSNYIIQLDTFSEETYSDLLKVQNEYLNLIDNTFGLRQENFNSFNFHLKPPSLKKPILREVLMRFINMPIDKRNQYIKEEGKIFENL